MIGFHDPQPLLVLLNAYFCFDSLDIFLLDADLCNELLTISPIENMCTFMRIKMRFCVLLS